MVKIDVLVLGGGISGLAAAWNARSKGHRDVLVLEESTRAGGSIHTLDVGGARFDGGASSTLLKHDRVRAFLRETGADADLMRPPREASRRYILRGGMLHPLPMGPWGFVTTPLFRARDKLRLLGEPWRKPAPPTAEETIAQFARRRLGESFLDNAVGPFVSGVFAGDPDRLVARFAAPALWSLEQEHGSLLRGALARRKGPGPPGELVNFRGGMQTLPDRVARALGEHTVRFGSRAERVTALGGGTGFRVEGRDATGAGFTLETKRLVAALPGRALPSVFASLSETAAAFEDLPYAPVASVFLVYRGVRGPTGFGFLRGRGEAGTRLLGCLFTSGLWPDRVVPDAQEVAFTCFYGGRTDPDAASLPEGELIALAHREVTRVLAPATMAGSWEAPARSAVRAWRPAIPQMEAGHGRFLAAAEALTAAHSGLHLTGNYLKGVSVSDCIDRALCLPLG